MCLNYKVLAGILVIIVLLYLFAPKFANFSWILLVLICPLSMILMMAGMQNMNEKPEDNNQTNGSNNNERAKQ